MGTLVRGWMAAVVGLLMGVVPVVVCGQVGGDTCAAAGIITENGSYSFNTTSASANDPCTPNVRTVWFRFVAPASGIIDADVCGSSFDTFMTVYAGQNCPLACSGVVAFNDDQCGDQSRVIFNALEGTTYHFTISGYAENDFGPGMFNFVFTPNSGEPGDTCDSAILITEDGTYAFDTTSASLDDPCPFAQSARAVWFRYEVETTGTIRATACPGGEATFDNTLSIHVTNGPCPTSCSSQVAMNTLCGFSEGEHAAEVFVEGGDTVFIVVSGVQAAHAGTGMLGFSFTAVEGGEDCGSAAILVNNGTYGFDTSHAGKTHPCRPEVRTLWYRYTADSDGRITANLCGSAYDSHLTVLTGSGCPLSCANVVVESDNSCGDDAEVSFNVKAGELFFFAVSGSTAEDYGLGALNFEFTLVSVGDTCAQAGEITTNGIYAWSNVGASTDDPCRGSSRTVWYKFTAPSNGEVLVDLCGLATFDTFVSAFVGECPPLCSDRIAFNDDFAGCGLRSRITFPVMEGETYNIALSGFGSVQGIGEVLILFTPAAGPVILGDINDDGLVNVADVTALAAMVAAGSPPDEDVGDVNDDGVVDDLDVEALAVMIVN